MNVPQTPGIYRGLSEADYAKIPAVRSSTLRKFMKATPAHFAFIEEDDSTRPHFELGKALHIAALEMCTYKDRVRVRREMPSAADLGCYSKTGKPGFWTDEQKALRDKLEAEIHAEIQGAEVVIDQEQEHDIGQMVLSLHQNSDWRALVDLDHETELTLVWEDDVTGLLCKARLDLWVPALGVWGELKHTKAYAMVRTFAKEIINYGYHHQAGFYWEGAEKLLGKLRRPQPCMMAVVENFEPYLSACRPLDFGALALGRFEMMQALREYADCKKSGRWPGHDSESVWELPGYIKTDDLEFAFTGGF